MVTAVIEGNVGSNADRPIVDDAHQLSRGGVAVEKVLRRSFSASSRAICSSRRRRGCFHEMV
jgi:hypothetical protein